MKREITSLPKWAKRILHAICPPELLEEIEGDLIQSINRKNKTIGSARVTWFLVVTVIRYMRPGIILRNKFSAPRINRAIIGNYFLTSYRHVLKDKVNSAFKLTGLTLAVFSLLVVSLYLSFQLSFDKHNVDYERIYRVNTQRMENGNVEAYGIAPMAFGPMLQNDFPEVEAYSRLEISNLSHLKYNNKIVAGSVFPADSSLFDIFSFTFVKGTKDAIRKPGSIVLTESLAYKLFGDEEALHQVVTVNGQERLFEVTGVIKDIAHNSHLRVDAFTPIDRKVEFSAQHIISPPDFVDNSSVLFVKLGENASVESFIQKLDKSLDKFVSARQRQELGFKVSLQPLADIYLAPPLKYEFTKKGSLVYLYIFIVLGIFLLVIACINYANLSLAGFMNRSREMGIRKVLGGRKSQIVLQIALDTSMYCLIALIFSAGLLYLLFPKIREYIEPNLQFSLISNSSFLLMTGTILFMMTIISATIPAIWFATNKITNDLKGIYARGGRAHFNNSLLLAQFVISVICICATLTVGRQISFIHNKDLGINRHNLLILTVSEDFTVNKMIRLKSALKNISGITHVSNSSFRMGGGFWKDWYAVESGNEMKSVELYEVFSDDELFETLGMKVLKGRTFDAQHKADSGAAFVINETAAIHLGLSDPVGRKIFTHPEDTGKWEGTIVGMVNDININTLHHKVQPLVMRLPWQNEWPEYFVYARINGDPDQIIKTIKSTYNEIQPGYPLEVHFVDDFYNNEYQKENRAFASLQFGTIIILIISSLGIFSLSVYLSVRRMKEFGIRKVLGATSTQITKMHVFHFMRIAALGFIIAMPVAYALMNEWLESFAYKISQDLQTFLMVFIITTGLIALSAGYAAIRAGKMNPVKIIKME